MNVVTVKSTQTLFDLALQKYGSADRVFDVIDDLGLENIESDPTGLEITPERGYVPNYYAARTQLVNNKPSRYYNSIDDALLVEENVFLVQNNGYKILL